MSELPNGWRSTIDQLAECCRSIAELDGLKPRTKMPMQHALFGSRIWR